MAEAMASVIDKLTFFIASYITEESLQRELTSIKNELQTIADSLQDHTDDGNDAAEAYERQTRELAYRIDDVVDEHVLLGQVPEIGSALGEIKAEILEFQRKRREHDIPLRTGGGRASTWEDRTDETDVVGLEIAEREVFELLELEERDGKEASVIAVVGMGGLGKTTLAWKVYESVDARRCFCVRAWINVSQRYSRKGFVEDLVQQCYRAAMQSPPTQLSQMDDVSVLSHLGEFLQDKRYMVVFDDVWDEELWGYVKDALPNNKLGSKILLTTRHEAVAIAWRGHSSTNNRIYKLKLLSPEKAWELFCTKAFQGNYYGGHCPQTLDDLSHGIVDKCEGLPLALVMLAGLLSTKGKDFSEWKRIHDNIGRELRSNSQLSSIRRILLSSYGDLPHFLKPCLLYFGIFPAGSSIEHNRLIKLWTAEDFVRPKDGTTIEDTAKGYLHELIQRSLVRVSVWYDSGRARAFRVHDLLHELLRIKLEELNFCQVSEGETYQTVMQSRRLAIQDGRLDNAFNSITGKCSFRSVLLFGAQEASAVSLSSSLLEKVFLLKVLDLQAAPVDHIPEEIGNLSLLQYLSLRFTKVKTIPTSIEKLQNLLTLDLKRCPVEELPVEIANLRKLRHCVVYQNSWHNTLKIWVIGAVKIPGGALGQMENLYKLADVNVAQSPGFLGQLGTFRELRYLAISNVTRENSVVLCKAIEKLECLESLNVTVDYDSDDPVDLQYIATPPSQLQRLYLIGPLENFPHWICKLQNLNKLRLRGSKLREIPFDVLQYLPELTMLGINKDVYFGERLVFQAGGFKKLKSMYFDSLINLNSVEIQDGALPLLESLLIQRLPRLREVPSGLQYLKRLNSLKIVEMTDEFADSIRQGSPLHHIIEHVADVGVGYQTPTGQYIYQKLY